MSLSIFQIVDGALLIIVHVSLVSRVDVKSESRNECKYISIAVISYKNRLNKQVLMKKMELANVFWITKNEAKSAVERALSSEQL